jgi:GT2 family glycosyltransferase
MPDPTVSVVVPTYQSAHYLPDAVRSALAQTIAPSELEIIVVDDGSSDDVEAALAPFRDRVRLIRIEHAGVSVARNVGILSSRGRFVAFLDADDEWLPDRLAAMLRLATREKNSLVSTDFFHERDGRRRSLGRYDYLGVLDLFGKSAREQYVAALCANFICYMQLVPKELFARVGTFDASLGFAEDYDLWLRFLEAGIPIRLVPQPLAVYRYMRPGSVTSLPSIKKAQDRVTVLERRRRDVPAWRWREVTGYLSRVRLRHALKERRYLSACRDAWRLAHNVHYLSKWAGELK